MTKKYGITKTMSQEDVPEDILKPKQLNSYRLLDALCHLAAQESHNIAL